VEVVTGDAGFGAGLCERLDASGVPSRMGDADERSACQILILDSDGTENNLERVVSARRTANPGMILLATGSAPGRSLLIRLMRCGALDFVEKPVRVDQLARRVCSLYERTTVTRMQAEVTSRLRNGATRIEQSRFDLHREIVRSNEELLAVNERLQKVVAQIRTLYHMGRDLGENENWSDALDRFLMALVHFMRAEGAALLLYSDGEERLRPRSMFQVGGGALESACSTIRSGRMVHPRALDIHPLESYGTARPGACLERTNPWSMTVIPLRHRNQWLGFLLLEKEYRDGLDFKWDYDFLSTLQTIFAEEIASASYISELRHLGRFNDKVLDNVQAGVVTTDAAGWIRYANAWATTMCPRLDRRTRGDHLESFDSLFLARSFSDGLFQSLMASPHDACVMEVTCRAGGEAEFPAQLRATRMFDDNLNGVVLVAIFEDLTERKRMESEIRRNDRLRVIGQLAAGVAHEIRNPLTGIANCAEVLAGKFEDDDGRTRYTDAMLEEIHRLDGIVKNLLTFARPPRPRIDACDVSGAVRRVLDLVSEQADDRGVTVALDVPAGETLCSADSGQLTQVLLNLVMNGILACTSGEHVRVVVGVMEGGRVVIEVEDDGSGVPDDVRDRLFEPFVTTRTQGTGLGLAISRQIVEDHDGNITCEFLHRGTRFRVELPGYARTAPGSLTPGAATG